MTIASVRGLSFRFGGGGPVALRDVDLDVAPGEVVVLEGPSGSGKSTLLRALGGLLGEFHGGRLEGQVRVCGHDAGREPASRLARVAALAFQDPEAQAVMNGVERDVAFGPESLGVPRDEITDRVGWALAEAGATHLRGRVVTALSGGERQRVALASVLAMRPRLLLLDEPTSQLDDPAASALLMRVRRLADHHGVGVVVAEHRADRAHPVADRVVRLEGVGIEDPRHHTRCSATAGPARAEFVGIHAGHPGRDVLRGLDLAVHAAQVTAVVGENGSGKTTLLRVLAGLHPASAGRVLLGGRDAGDVPAERRFPRVGLVPQAPGRFLLCEQVDAELAYALRRLGVRGPERRVRITSALEAHGIAHLSGRHPLDLSVGERERVAIAAMAVARPGVLALDEPTRGIDPGARRALGARLRSYAAEGGAVLVATHDPAFVAEWCDRVVLLQDGRAIESTPAVPAA